MNLLESVPPKVSSPFTFVRFVVGSNEMATSRAEIVPMYIHISDISTGEYIDYVTLRKQIVCHGGDGREETRYESAFSKVNGATEKWTS